MTICSLSVIDAATRAENDPFGFTSAGVDDLRVRFTIETVSCTPAAPCVPVIVARPAESGIDAARLPAAGIDGGVVSRLVNCAVTSAGRCRPTRSVTPAPTRTVYVAFACRASVGRSVSTVSPFERLTLADTAQPATLVIRALPAFAPFTDAAAIGFEKRITMGLE